MKILVLAIIVFFSQFSFVYAAKPFCQDNADDFSLAMVSGILGCLLYTSPSPRDQRGSRMPSSA